MMKTIDEIKSMKWKEKITVLTAYDYSIARAIDSACVDIILVGDSQGMVVLGYDNTLFVAMEDMMKSTKAVKRAVKNAPIVADMPVDSYDTKELALKNAKKLINAGADAVKPENKPDIIKYLVQNNIHVMGHIGLTPQTITDYKVQGKDKETAVKLIKLAKEIEQAGAFSIVLECIPMNLAKEITEKLKIPTIGIGAGPYCDGQVLVSYDMLGLYNKLKPKFVKQYTNLSEQIKKAVLNYKKEVKEGKFPAKEFSFE